MIAADGSERLLDASGRRMIHPVARTPAMKGAGMPAAGSWSRRVGWSAGVAGFGWNGTSHRACARAGWTPPGWARPRRGCQACPQTRAVGLAAARLAAVSMGLAGRPPPLHRLLAREGPGPLTRHCGTRVRTRDSASTGIPSARGGRIPALTARLEFEPLLRRAPAARAVLPPPFVPTPGARWRGRWQNRVGGSGRSSCRSRRAPSNLSRPGGRSARRSRGRPASCWPRVRPRPGGRGSTAPPCP